MRRIIIIVLTFFCILKSFGQTKINPGLKKELDSIYIEDQKYRELLFSDILRTRADSIAGLYNIPKSELPGYLMNAMQKADSLNMIRIEQIIDQYGYPGKSLAGEPTNEAAFFVIQHSQKIDQYLPLIKKAADKKELSFKLYAMMLDRSLMYHGKEQVYGTQGKGIQIINTETGKKEFKMIIWPIKHSNTVNKRRKKAGFDETVEENAKRLGIDYKPLTLKEVENMKGQ